MIHKDFLVLCRSIWKVILLWDSKTAPDNPAANVLCFRFKCIIKIISDIIRPQSACTQHYTTICHDFLPMVTGADKELWKAACSLPNPRQLLSLEVPTTTSNYRVAFQRKISKAQFGEVKKMHKAHHESLFIKLYHSKKFQEFHIDIAQLYRGFFPVDFFVGIFPTPGAPGTGPPGGPTARFKRALRQGMPGTGLWGSTRTNGCWML